MSNNKPGTDKEYTYRELFEDVCDIAKLSVRLGVKTGTTAAKDCINVAGKIAQRAMQRGAPVVLKGSHTVKNMMEDHMVPFVKDYWKEILLAVVVSSTTYVATDSTMDRYDQWKGTYQKTSVEK